MGEHKNPRPKSGNERTEKRLNSITENVLRETARIFKEDLTADLLRTWGVILHGCTDTAICWAFENWNRNGEFFPKPAVIIDLIHTFAKSPENQMKFCGSCHCGWVITNPEAKPSDFVMRRCECVQVARESAKVPVQVCDAECKKRHGRGYHTNDVLWLWKQRQLSAKPWSEAQWEAALSELDSKRSGGAPMWRRV